MFQTLESSWSRKRWQYKSDETRQYLLVRVNLPSIGMLQQIGKSHRANDSPKRHYPVDHAETDNGFKWYMVIALVSIDRCSSAQKDGETYIKRGNPNNRHDPNKIPDFVGEDGRLLRWNIASLIGCLCWICILLSYWRGRQIDRLHFHMKDRFKFSSRTNITHQHLYKSKILDNYPNSPLI